MKHLLFGLLSLVLPASLPAQYFMRDALALRSCFVAPDATDPDKRVFLDETALNDTHREIFKAFLGLETVTPDKLEKGFAGNPLLRVEVTSQSFLQIGKSGSAPASPGQTPGFSVASFADGLARFLVKRTKQELALSFFNDFKEALDNQPLLKRFFPGTEGQLQLVDQEIYDLQIYLGVLRESFIGDLYVLPGNLEGYVRENPKADKNRLIIDVLHIAQQAIDKEAPVDMLHYFAGSEAAIQGADPATQPELFDFAAGIQVLNFLSESLRKPAEPDATEGWYTDAEIREAMKDPLVREIYFGLLWQRSNVFTFSNGAKLQPLIGAIKTGDNMLQPWLNVVSGLGKSTTQLSKTVAAGDATTEEATDKYYRYIQSFTGLLESANLTGKLILGRPDDLVKRQYIQMLQQGNSLFLNLRQRNFTAAISNVIAMLNYIGSDKEEVSTLLRYANFMGAIAAAQSPEEMENAIEMFALPPGSSQAKKQPGRFSVALNAYSGVAGGSEYLDNSRTPQGVFSLAAPVGVSCNWGIGQSSLGFFVPIIDVGAVTAFRFNDKTGQDLPEMTWDNILAPGLYLVYDTPKKWPLALGIGAQIGPNLRKIEVTGGTDPTYREANGWRLGAFATIDIPVTYFHLGKPNPAEMEKINARNLEKETAKKKKQADKAAKKAAKKPK
ncbi:MAG: hypothetical protein IT260_01845 [Saprospiraceae bacterium]|nr:hypothetical protein [Saprospiraceae bacterium]